MTQDPSEPRPTTDDGESQAEPASPEPGSPTLGGRDAGEGLVATARRIGHHAWVERQLFEWLGRWSGTPTTPEVTVFFGQRAAIHGWHSEVLFERLPQLREIGAESLVAPRDDTVRRLVETLCSEPQPDGAVAALAGHVRVMLPLLLSSYRDLRSKASVVSDPSTVRWIGMVLADDLDEWQQADSLLRRLLRGPADIDEAIARQRELELIVAGSDLLLG